MRLCQECHQALSEEVSVCPVCGNPAQAGRAAIDDYQIDAFINEGHDWIAYKAHRAGDAQPVFIRLFKPEAGITPAKAAHLHGELESLRSLSPERFVRHLELRQSSEGLWYRVSEWLDAVKWGDLIATGFFLQVREAAEFLAGLADGMSELHRAGLVIPHLTLDDVLPVRAPDGRLSVKIDYKLSRFINPELPHPQPALAALLAIHPDLKTGRALDFRTDTWSMGRLFATLLTDEDDWSAALAKLQASDTPPRLKTLIHQMLELEPDQRPASAEVIAKALRDSAVDEVHHAEAVAADRKLASWRPSLALGMVLLLGLAGAVAIFLQVRYGLFSRDSSTRLGRYAEQYRRAVAFVVTGFEVDVDNKPVYANASEGTAFLVGDDGYLLTNRHVACPWLDDPEVDKLLERLQGTRTDARLKYRILIWFDGQPALRRSQKLPAKGIDQFLEDRYLVNTAQRSSGMQGVRIAGILPPPRSLRARLRSPLSDDAAFLKLDRVPPGVKPLPLPAPGASRPPSLEPVLILGFPLGSEQNLGAEVVASASIGNIRRTFENVYQVSASIHPGNSGGPVIDAEGRVLGIASASAMLEELMRDCRTSAWCSPWSARCPCWPS